MRWVTVATEQGPRACGVWQGQYVDVNAADPGLPSTVRGLLALDADDQRAARGGRRAGDDVATTRPRPGCSRRSPTRRRSSASA